MPLKLYVCILKQIKMLVLNFLYHRDIFNVPKNQKTVSTTEHKINIENKNININRKWH